MCESVYIGCEIVCMGCEVIYMGCKLYVWGLNCMYGVKSIYIWCDVYV